MIKLLLEVAMFLKALLRRYNVCSPMDNLTILFRSAQAPALSNNFPAVVQFIKIYDSKIFIVGIFDRFNGDVCQSLVILDKDGKKIGPEKNATTGQLLLSGY